MAIAKAKLFLESKTFWINFVGIAVLLIQVVLQTNFVIDKDVQAILLAILNILIRFKTTEPIRLR